jgi:putative transposase
VTDIIESMPKPIDAQQLAAELVEKARAEGIDLVGPGGLLTGLTKTVLETALDAELTDHLGYDKHDPAGRTGGNSRNGTRVKTVLTEVGPVEIEVPRIGTAASIRRSCASGSAGWTASTSWCCR